MSSWTQLLRLRQGDLAPVTVTVHRDNFGGLVLFIDEGDGAKVTGVPLSEDERLKLAEVLMTKEPW